MKNGRTNPDFLNGVPELLILRLLSRHPMHGYELVQSIRRSTGEALAFGEGCIYPLLHRLESDGLLSSRQEPVSGRSRIVYQVTARGTRRLTEATAAWKAVVRAIEQALQGGDHAQPALA
jgi:PadR family transcriptional regulator PadR